RIAAKMPRCEATTSIIVIAASPSRISTRAKGWSSSPPTLINMNEAPQMAPNVSNTPNSLAVIVPFYLDQIAANLISILKTGAQFDDNSNPLHGHHNLLSAQRLSDSWWSNSTSTRWAAARDSDHY